MIQNGHMQCFTKWTTPTSSPTRNKSDLTYRHIRLLSMYCNDDILLVSYSHFTTGLIDGYRRYFYIDISIHWYVILLWNFTHKMGVTATMHLYHTYHKCIYPIHVFDWTGVKLKRKYPLLKKKNNLTH